MRVIIRADSSSEIGSGHVMRCLVLADALRQRGALVEFVSKHATGDLIGLIEERGYKTSENSLFGEVFDWLVVDNYELGLEWESSMREYARKIMVIDDIGRDHNCDLLINPQREYALISPLYAKLRNDVHKRAGVPKKILISFGGSNVDAQTKIAVDVVRAVFKNNVEILAYDSKNRVPTLAPAILYADLAIGAGGGTTWERLCLGLPSLVVTIADNQIPAVRSLDREKLLWWVGGVGGDSDWPANLRGALESIMENGLEPSWSERCMELVDGRGVERVADAIYQAS